MTFRRDYKSLQRRKIGLRTRKRQKGISRAKKINTLLFVISLIVFTWAILNKETNGRNISEDINHELNDTMKGGDKEDKKLVKRDVSVSLPRWKYIVIHHSGIDVGDKERYKNFHKDKYGSDSLLYHFVIGNGFANGASNGVIEVGERWRKQQVGGHVSNEEYNKYGIGICLVGNINKRPPTKKQMSSLLSLVQYLMGKFNIAPKNVVLHKEVNATACPGNFFPIYSFKQSIESIILASKVEIQ